MEEPEFDAAYREARRTAFRQSVARLQQASGAAVTTLQAHDRSGHRPSTRARAADSALDHSAKAIELEDIEARGGGAGADLFGSNLVTGLLSGSHSSVMAAGSCFSLPLFVVVIARK